MAKLADRANVFFGDSVFRAGPLTEMELGRQYSQLMHRLYATHGLSDVHYCDPARMRAVLERPDCMMSFVIHDGRLVATAEALLIRSEPFWNAIFGNIITRNGQDGNGFGALAHDSLERHVRTFWGREQPLILVLTNSDEKDNIGFYTTRGWSIKETNVLVKMHRPAAA
jgi:hypothetical protein